ncbi:MAG: peptide/nickel transport system permease protein [Thermomicrobiales bacterium]|nr:peptide/nickel transport system permease protein [Thermomicrobiales bacterium]
MSAIAAEAPLATTRTAGRLAPLARFARQSRAGLVAGVVLLAFVLGAAAAPLLAPADPNAMNPIAVLRSPDGDALLGTDFFGRDILSRVLYGARISLAVGASSVIASALVGTALGLIAGYIGRWPEYLVMRLMDVLFAFPAVLLAILIVSVFGSGLTSIVAAIAVVYTPIFARVVRGSTLAVKNVEYVQAAVAAGATPSRVMTRHVLPNVAAPILVQLALSLSGAVILEAALSYLGLGAVPPTPSLGSMLSENRTTMELAPWTVLYPGLALAILVLAINIFGDAVRDLLDPRLRTEA